MTTNTKNMVETFIAVQAARGLWVKQDKKFLEKLAKENWEILQKYARVRNDSIAIMDSTPEQLNEINLDFLASVYNNAIVVIRGLLAAKIGTVSERIVPEELTGELVETPNGHKMCIPFELSGVRILVTTNGYVELEQNTNPCAKCIWNTREDVYNCVVNCNRLQKFKMLERRKENIQQALEKSTR